MKNGTEGEKENEISGQKRGFVQRTMRMIPGRWLDSLVVCGFHIFYMFHGQRAFFKEIMNRTKETWSEMGFFFSRG